MRYRLSVEVRNRFTSLFCKFDALHFSRGQISGSLLGPIWILLLWYVAMARNSPEENNATTLYWIPLSDSERSETRKTDGSDLGKDNEMSERYEYKPNLTDHF